MKFRELMKSPVCSSVPPLMVTVLAAWPKAALVALRVPPQISTPPVNVLAVCKVRTLEVPTLTSLPKPVITPVVPPKTP